LQVKQKKDGIFISQDKYVAEILRKFRLSEGKSASTPIDAKKPLLKDSDGEDVDVHTYRCSKELCIHRLVVHDEDLKTLAITRGKDLRSLKIKKCKGFSTYGLMHVSKSDRDGMCLTRPDFQV
nr:leucine-rich repeat, cysteine-containing subtype [Tanacetum cinerariifolium]